MNLQSELTVTSRQSPVAQSGDYRNNISQLFITFYRPNQIALELVNKNACSAPYAFAQKKGL
ncbi:hypothetical protein HC248_01243 [Polaromonas vacuolata]|uniref:Uncharacterized protein n=1 Tax=Polaromonas vacuolata TaxID=37448 RepID=A0A6H2H7W0_9BURK|nr:hypothetical protein [Polaromonas vacuolata]QJC55959.1 hypothetical protein HC248_01243 [Polaromonas vacuolata]